MCGGRGGRLDSAVEKPLFEIGGRPMVERVHDALRGSAVETIYAAVSPQAPRTGRFVAERGLETVDTPGEGYVADLEHALETVEPPVLTVAADLVLLEPDAVEPVLAAADGSSVTVGVPLEVKRLLGLSVDLTLAHAGRELAPAGLNVVADAQAEETLVSYDVRLAVNVNRMADAHVAERLL